MQAARKRALLSLERCMSEPKRPLLQIPVQPPLHAALKLGAEMQMTTVSEFCRRALIDRLRADGIDPLTATRPLCRLAAAPSTGPAIAAAERQLGA